MRRQQQLDPDLMRQQQQMELLGSMGIQLDPLKQMSGLVDLINQTQAPGIQQQQFGEEMDYRQAQADRGFEMNQAELQQRQLAEQNNQRNFGQTFGLQEQQFQQQQEYQQGMLDNKEAMMEGAALDRTNNNKMDFATLLMKMLGNPNGAGMIDPNVAAQTLAGMGFQGLINPKMAMQQRPLYDTSGMNGDLDDEAFNQSFRKHTGQ